MFFLKRWNFQDQNLKDELIKDIEHEFGSNIFYHKKLLQKASKHLKVVRDSYRKSLILNLKYEHPPFVLVRDGNEFILDVKEKGEGQKESTRFCVHPLCLKKVLRYLIHMLTQLLSPYYECSLKFGHLINYGG